MRALEDAPIIKAVLYGTAIGASFGFCVVALVDYLIRRLNPF